jgi:hypothetical protein
MAESAPGRLLASIRRETANDPDRARRMKATALECAARWRKRLAEERERRKGGTT